MAASLLKEKTTQYTIFVGGGGLLQELRSAKGSILLGDGSASLTQPLAVGAAVLRRGKCLYLQIFMWYMREERTSDLW